MLMTNSTRNNPDAQFHSAVAVTWASWISLLFVSQPFRAVAQARTLSCSQYAAMCVHASEKEQK